MALRGGANAIPLLDVGDSCVQIAKLLYQDDDTIRDRYKSCRDRVWGACR